MTKLQLLHRALNERLMAAVEQIMEMVGGTVLEYEEETIRARKENEVLRRRLRWMQGANPADWPGPSEPITLSTPDESNPSQQDECAVNFGFGQESEGLVIKTETTDHPLYSATTLPQRIDQGSDVAGTSTGITYGLADGMTWDSAQSYMAPLDFDPTSGSTRIRHWRGQNRRQRMSFACPDCGKVFGREQRLMIHMRIHSTERPYKYRRRKAFFYGDNKKKRKLHGLSQLSREIVDDLSDCSEQTSRSSVSPDRLAPDQEEEPGGLSTESDHTSSDKEPENRTTTPVRDRRKKKTGSNQMQCHCPHCPDRVFARPCQLAMHMKTHTVKALVNLPNQAQSGTDEIMDVKMKSPPKKQRKNDAVKKDKDAGKSEFHCPKCDKVFGFATKLRFHMKSHKAEKALSHKTLKMPIQTEPSKEETMEAVPKTTEVQNLQELKKTFACPHCDKVFIREGWLEPHIRSQHRKVKKRRSPCEIMLDSSRTRSQRPYYQQLRKRTAEKQGVTEESKQLKNEESKKVNDKPSQSIDESNLVVAGYTQQLRKRTAEKQGVTKELKQNNEESKKVNAKPSPSIDVSNLVVAGYTQQLRKRRTETQGVTKELKQKNEESKKVNAKPSPSSDESNLVVDVPKITTDEAEQSPDLPKRGTDESMCTPEQTKDTSVSNRETTITKKLKRFPCKVCGKAFVGEKKLKKHSRKHMRRRLPNEKKRKSEEALGETELMEQAGMRREEDKERLDKTSRSNHNPNTQTPQGSSNKELQKGKTRGQGPLPCPFCGKVFAWEMRLLMHMQIHCGEKPYSYRRREKRFYGDLKRGQLPKIHNQEPPGNNSDKSEESVGEETVNEDRSAHLSSSTTHAVSGALASSTETTGMEDCTGSLGLLPQTAIEQPTTCNKSNQTVKPELFSDVMSHFSLQPRIVLQPIMTECKYWSSVSGDLKSGCSERSGFDHEEPSCSVLVDDDEMVDAVEDKIVGSNLCIMPVERSGHGIQNKPEICHSVIPETEIFPIEVGSPQQDSQSEIELDNFGGPLAIESTEGNNTESQQKEDHDCYVPGVSEKTAINQLPLIIIDDKLEQSNTRTAAEHAPSECGRMKCDSKCDCTNISTMKLTVMPQTSDLRSLFKETISGAMQKKIDSELVCVILSDVEDDVDEDVLMCSSKELDKKKTTSVPSIENEQLDVGSKPGENPSSDYSFPAPDATESIKTDESTCVHAKSVDGTFKHTGVQVVTSERNDQSILNYPLTRNQIDCIAIRQTEDNPMNLMEERPFQTSENPSSDSNFPAPDATESIKTDESTCVHANSIDGTSKHTDVQVVASEKNDQSISNDPLTRDQMASITITQTEDNRMNSMEEISCQTSDMVFAGQASLSEVNADKKLVDMEIVSGDERKNKLCEQPESVLDDLTDNSEISGKNEPSVQKGPECQSNSTDDLFKIHHCCYCKQPHYRMMDHLQSVHPNEPEVAKALSFDQSSQERKHLLNLLQTKGNVLHCTNVVQSSKQDLKPFSMFASDCSFDDSVYCIYCLGLFNKKSFATHLEQCKGKSIDSAEDSCDEILPNAGPVPPTPTLTSPWSPEEIDANLEPSGFQCLNTTYETEQLNLYNEQGSSSHQDVTCSVVQLDVSSLNEGVRNDGQTEGANLQFRYSPENEVSYDFKSVNSRNPKTGQESTDCKNEEISLPICDIDQERTMTATSDTCAIKAHQEYVVLRNPYDDFSPPQSNPTVSNDRVKAQTYGTGRRRKRKRRSHVQNKSLIMGYGLLGEGEGPNSKIHVCQHCRATFCSSYTLRRHEYTHTGERPFWCHHCNVGFIQKYRLLKHTFAYHGDMSTNTDLEKLKRPKRRIQGRETSMKDEVSLEPSAKSPKDLPDAVNDDTEEKVAATMQDTEARGFHWEEAGHSKIKD